MSFASEVKKEIISISPNTLCCKKALLMGLMQGSTEIVIGQGMYQLILKFPILNAIKIVIPLFKELYGINLNERIATTTTSLGHKYYCLEIKEQTKRLIDDFKLMPYDEITLDNHLLKKECCQAYFLKGLFVVKGSINDPRKERYHLEINCKKDSVALVVQTILKSKDIEAKIVLKGQNSIVYVKKSEEIRDCLALLGANSGIFYFEDARIYRDYVNQVNRLTNCDIANAKRSAETCKKQLNIIKKIRESGYFNQMSVRLQTIAKMREEYPDATLDELAEVSDKIFGKMMSKSGINHCFSDLINYYNSLNLK